MMIVTCGYVYAHLTSHFVNEAANFANWRQCMVHLCLIFRSRSIILTRYVVTNTLSRIETTAKVPQGHRPECF
jgi:hypothetical protein